LAGSAGADGLAITNRAADCAAKPVSISGEPVAGTGLAFLPADAFGDLTGLTSNLVVVLFFALAIIIALETL
jgi:hypothetical protein